MMKSAMRLGTLAVLLLLMVAPASQAGKAVPPSIDTVLANYVGVPSCTLTISGSGFGLSQPVVKLGGQTLIVNSHTPTSITAQFPCDKPKGDYKLLVQERDSRKGLSDAISFSVGAGIPGYQVVYADNSVAVQCQGGRAVIGGGCTCDDTNALVVNESAPLVDLTGWQCFCVDEASAAPPTNGWYAPLRIYAICAYVD